MFVCMLGKNIFPLIYTIVFQGKKSLGSHLFLIIMRIFSKEKTLNMKDKILCASSSG